MGSEGKPQVALPLVMRVIHDHRHVPKRRVVTHGELHEQRVTAFTALAWVLILLLRLGDKLQDRPMTV